MVRLPGRGTELLGIDRAAEARGDAGGGEHRRRTRLVAFVPELGVLVTEYIDARPATADELRARLPEVAALLRRIHAGPEFPVPCSPLGRAESYRAEAERRGGAIPANYDEVHAAAERIVAALPHRPVPIHSDLLTANFLLGDALSLVDWEYAGMGDARFDLANFASHHELDADGERALVAAYYGEATPQRLAAVRLLRLLAAFWEGMWGVLQASVSDARLRLRGLRGEHLGKLGGGDAASSRTWSSRVPVDRSLPGARALRDHRRRGRRHVDRLPPGAARLERRAAPRSLRPDERVDVPLRRAGGSAARLRVADHDDDVLGRAVPRAGPIGVGGVRRHPAGLHAGAAGRRPVARPAGRRRSGCRWSCSRPRRRRRASRSCRPRA